MHIWLPPSEGKDSPTHGPSLDLSGLSVPALFEHRQRVAAELQGLAQSVGAEKAAQILGLGAKSKADVELNSALFTSPCAPMENVFTGVLFSAARLADFDEAARSSLRHRLSIFSGLFGIVRLGDLIPDHRLSMGVKLPSIGSVGASWKPVVDEALRHEYAGEVIVDMRSGPYRSACPAAWAHVWQVGVVREVGSQRSVISHNAKYWRGLLAGHLLRLPSQRLAALDAQGVADASLMEEVLSEATQLPPMTDAKGVSHRVTGVELSTVTPTRQGGSTRTVTLVTD